MVVNGKPLLEMDLGINDEFGLFNNSQNVKGADRTSVSYDSLECAIFTCCYFADSENSSEI